ncbi:MAG: hypothetical protein B7Z08_11605, partial [Sphingomonadales bacterium 32-68-7]
MRAAEMSGRADALADRVYVELVRSLYMNLVPAMIMSGAFMLSFTLISVRDGDPYVLATGVMGVLASLGRLGLTRALRQRALTATLDRTEARKLELAFAVPF